MDYISALLTIPLGVVITLKYAVLSFLFGLLIGLVVVGMQLCKVKALSYLAQFYISVLRGTPVLLQLSICYFALPSVLNCEISVVTAGILCFSLNSSAYVAEILRGGILSIDKGQFEAADVLNLSWFQKYYYIIAPQVARNTIPALLNEAINLIKESAIVSILGEQDIMRKAQLVTSQYYTFFTPLLVAGATYYIVILIVTFLTKIVENKMSFYS